MLGYYIRRLMGKIPLRGLPSGVSLLVAIVMVAILPAYALAASLEETPELVNPHNFVVKKYCGSCHAESPPELSFDAVTTCTKCHPANIGNHPVSRGRLVCHTCHDPHNKSVHRRMLRVDYFGLCASCHKGY
jgi:predicted CXXCH cytochrome family protein